MTSDSTTLRRVVDALVDAGLLDPARRGEADAVVRDALGGDVAPAPLTGSLRRRMAEIAGYVGGAFVVGAAALFFSATWADLTLGVQVGLMLGTAAVLVAAALALAAAAHGRGGLVAEHEAVRRRLTSVLMTGAAGSAAFGTGLLLGDRMDDGSLALTLAALVGLVVSAAGYLLAPTTVGQLGIVVPVLVAVPAFLDSLDTESSSPLPVAGLYLLLGAAWLVLAERGVWREVLPARVIGCVVAVFGAQLPVFDDPAWVGYVVTAAVGVAAFWLYVVSRAWPYLATGVVAVTIAVPEALSDWFEGALGAAGVLLATGVTLLLAALAGLRLRQEVTEG
jgi:hypothetical protein